MYLGYIHYYNLHLLLNEIFCAVFAESQCQVISTHFRTHLVFTPLSFRSISNSFLIRSLCLSENVYSGISPLSIMASSAASSSSKFFITAWAKNSSNKSSPLLQFMIVASLCSYIKNVSESKIPTRSQRNCNFFRKRVLSELNILNSDVSLLFDL